MDTSSLKRIRDLRHSAKLLTGFHDKVAALRQDSRNDKLGFGFNTDSRFSAFSVSLSFDSWCGQYGSSSCGRILSVDGDIAKKFVVAALNKHSKQIFDTAAALMEAEGAAQAEKARAEIAALQAMVDEIDAPPSPANQAA